MAPSRKRKRGIRRAASRPSPIPPGYPTVIPYLAVTAGAAALDFYPKAFGAKVLARELTPDGKLVHGRLRIGNSLFMVSDVFPGGDVAAPSTVGTTTVTLHLYSKNVDALWDRAVAAGAKVTMPLENQDLGGAVRPPARSVRPPLVALDAGQDEPGRKRRRSRRRRWPRSREGNIRGENLATATPERLAIRAVGGRVERTGPVRFARRRDPRGVGRGRNPPPTGSEPDRRRMPELRGLPLGSRVRERRLAEQAGRVFPPAESGEATWQKLQAAVNGVKVTVHRPA